MMMLNPLQKPFSSAKTLIFFPPNPSTKTTSPFVVSSSKQGDPPPVTKPNPRPRRRGRKSEAEAVEDFVRTTLERAISAVRDADPESIPTGQILKDRVDVDTGPNSDDDEEEGGEVAGGRRGRKFVVEEVSEDWPVDTDVGWGIRSSEYFEKHPIRNVVGDDGEVIDWEGEMEDGWVKEINCLEWESFAFHPSPLVVLVFERFARASDNWKALKELESAIKVYWSSKDRLPPRAVKVDINIERDLAYALKVKEGPQILFLRGHRILYREKGFLPGLVQKLLLTIPILITEIRTADELIQMIAHFYYKARMPSFITIKT